MTPRVELTCVDRAGRARKVVVERRRADLILGLARRGAWPGMSFRHEPFEEPSIMAAIFAAILAFLVKFWQVPAVAAGLLALVVLVHFAPGWERPLLFAGPFVGFGLGVTIDRTYLK